MVIAGLPAPGAAARRAIPVAETPDTATSPAAGDAFDDMPIGSLPAGTGKTMRFTGITVLKVENGLITEEVGLDDGVTVLRQLGLITEA